MSRVGGTWGSHESAGTQAQVGPSGSPYQPLPEQGEGARLRLGGQARAAEQENVDHSRSTPHGPLTVDEACHVAVQPRVLQDTG